MVAPIEAVEYLRPRAGASLLGGDGRRTSVSIGQALAWQGIDYVSVEQLGEALTELNLKQYVETFRSEDIDGRLLVQMDDAMLEEDLGITNSLHRLKILNLAKASA